MKMAICVQYIDNSPIITGYFSAAEYFMIYNTYEKLYKEKIVNNFRTSISSEIFCAQLLIKRGINTVICGKCDNNAKKLFSEAKIKLIENIESPMNDFLFEYVKQDKKYLPII